jgi:ferredoxin-NADP reductase/DMSO/TMAO reductase YedYZ heme-binding membrane subunit
MSFSVVWGVLLASRVFRGLDNPAWLKDLHKYLSTLTVLLASVHTTSLMLDPYVKFDAADLLIPGVATYEGATEVINIALAVGVVAMWIMMVVYLSSLVMDKLPHSLWKAIHYLSYLVFFAIGIHAAFSGSDVGSWWYAAVSIFVISMTMIALLIRFAVISLRERRAVADAKVAALRAAAQAEREANALDNPDEDSREKRTMVVQSVTPRGEGILGIRLIPVGGGRTAWWEAGAHITLHLPNGMERQYSLCGDTTDRTGYDIAVLDTHGPEGGSTWIHNNITAGTVLPVSGPRNHFPLVPARTYLFIAGGIGITPIRAMIESLPAKREWHLLYLGKSREGMAFADEVVAEYGKQVTIHESAVSGRFDLARLLDSTNADVYCCGPESLMSEVEQRVDKSRAHLERFIPVHRELDGGAKPVTVRLASTGKKVAVGADVSLADALKKAGVPIETSCGKGVCGTCELRVIDGTPAHLDSVMSDDEKDKLGVFYPCVSRAVGAEITVDA